MLAREPPQILVERINAAGERCSIMLRAQRFNTDGERGHHSPPCSQSRCRFMAAANFGFGCSALSSAAAKACQSRGLRVIISCSARTCRARSCAAASRKALFDTLGNQSKNTVPWDSGEHGTHTAGTIVGRPVSGVSFGVAPAATLASAMVIEGGNVLARILAGMNWVVGLQVRVLSMSLGLIGTADTFLQITRVLRARGVLPVFAVGNEGAGRSRYPGNYAECLSVGAMGSDGIVADFSGSQQFLRPIDPLVPDLVSPGVDVVSSIPNNDYAQMSGTSMATPHIAGLAALLMQAKPTKTISEIEAAIFASCVLQPGMLQSRANRGLPDGVKALSLL